MPAAMMIYLGSSKPKRRVELRSLSARVRLRTESTRREARDAMTTEADTCRKYVVPKLQAAGWEEDPHSIAEQRTLTDGRIIVAGSRVRRRKGKRADYLLRYTRGLSACGGRSQGRVQDSRSRAAAGQGVRRDPRPQVRLLHQRARHRRVRLPHRTRAEPHRVPIPAGAVVALREGSGLGTTRNRQSRTTCLLRSNV